MKICGAEVVLEKHLKVKDYGHKKNNLDSENFNFGIQKHIDLGIASDLCIGIYNLYVYWSSRFQCHR